MLTSLPKNHDDRTKKDPSSALRKFLKKKNKKIPGSETSNSGSSASATKLPAKALEVVPSVIKQMQMENLQQYIDSVGGSLSTNHVSGRNSLEQQQTNFSQNSGGGWDFLDETGEFVIYMKYSY